jgi:glycogen debranching enzyme
MWAILVTVAIGWPGAIEASDPRTVEEAVGWLRGEAKTMIRASRRTMKDGVAAFLPQAGGGYDAFWLRDYDYMVEGCVDAFSNKELTDACTVFVNAQRADGACVDCVRLDGTPIFKPGGGTMGENPVADGSPFTVAVAWHTYRRVHDRALLQRIIGRLVKAMEAVPRNPATGLVHIRPGGYDRCPYGFTDTVREQGDVLFCSLLQVEASKRLADLLATVGRPADAEKWRNEAGRLAASIRTVFWDPSLGLFRAATVQCKEPDIWGSAFAVYLGVASREQSLAVAKYFQRHYGQIVERGQIRHLPGGVHWQAAGPKDEYQNGGFWATPTGWFVYTLDLVDPSLADRTVLDMVGDFRRKGIMEWVLGEKKGVPDYVASVALPIAGIEKMLGRRKAAHAAGE